MGIPTVPDEYGDDCTHCWPAGKTPSRLWASVTGIKPAGLTPPGGHLCPNGIFLLDQHDVNPCSFQSSSWPQICGINVYSPWSTFGLEDINGEQAFYKQYFQSCVFEFENAIVDYATNYYYQGHVSVKACLDDDDNDLLTIMKLLNIPQNEKTFCEFFPISDSRAIFKYCRKSDKSNISIKVNL